MCGIAGLFRLDPRRPAARSDLDRMAQAQVHRGPDEFGVHLDGHVGLACRRLALVDPAGGGQPLFNEDRSVAAVFNGELFDYRERREDLLARGHRPRGHGDAELLVHLWEDHGEAIFPHLRGQFAFGLYDARTRTAVLARDRLGICPLHWAVADGTLYFASEVKAILAAGVPARADPCGLENVLVTFCLPGRRTAFAGIQSLLPGHYLTVRWTNDDSTPVVREQRYWDLDFPGAGSPSPWARLDEAVDDFAAAFDRAVRLRLRADAPVAAYLSGGVDSSYVVHRARAIRGGAITTFTVAVDDYPTADAARAGRFAAALGCTHRPVRCAARDLAAAFPRAVAAADAPVGDVTCGSLLALSRAARDDGFKAVLTGEGADEALAGYSWFKAHRALSAVGRDEWRPLLGLANTAFQAWFPRAPAGWFAQSARGVGGTHAHMLLYRFTSFARWRLLSPDFAKALNGYDGFADLGIDPDRVRRWDPLNGSLYFGYKTMLPGLLLGPRGDRAAMAHSVEARYPFLDEDVVDLCARLPPDWKLRRIVLDKFLLRRAAGRHLPAAVARRPKEMFRAHPFEAFLTDPPAYAAQLLSPEALRRTPYFDADRVTRHWARCRSSAAYRRRVFVQMALAAVLGVQCWHHLYLGDDLCELPKAGGGAGKPNG